MKKHPLKSRKFWAGILSSLAMLITYYTGHDVEEALLGLIPVIIWIISESIIDARHIRRETP